LPEMDQSFAEGSLHFSVVRELSRVATAETEQEWLAFAQGKTARELERESGSAQAGFRVGRSRRGRGPGFALSRRIQPVSLLESSAPATTSHARIQLTANLTHTLNGRSHADSGAMGR
jgi:hypothetical protein